MRIWTRLLIVVVVLAAGAASLAYYLNRERLSRRWAAQGVASATSFEEAGSKIAALENHPGRDSLIRDLAGQWGRRDQQLDLYLAWYAGSAKSSEFLRETFSLEFGWREELLPRWAHYWSWRAPQEPDRQIESIVGFLDLLAQSETPRPITWREVLDLQAVFVLTSQPRLAKRLSPENWAGRYQQWQKGRPQPLPHVARPEQPFPDWQGPVPDRRRLASQ